MSATTTPTDIRLHRKSGILELVYQDGTTVELSAEFLRVHSPSAEVRGHGKGQEVLQTGKKHVKINEVEPIGNYAIRLIFDDKHDSGIYSWDYLKELGDNQQQYWSDYLAKLRTPAPHGSHCHREPRWLVLSLRNPKSPERATDTPCPNPLTPSRLLISVIRRYRWKKNPAW